MAKEVFKLISEFTIQQFIEEKEREGDKIVDFVYVFPKV